MQAGVRVALTTWNGRISPVLDVARQALVAEVEDGRVVGRSEEPLPGTEPSAQAARLAALAPEVLICGAVSQPMAMLLAGTGIRLIPFTAGETEDVIEAWMNGRLPDPAWQMPGCCGRGPRGGAGRGGLRCRHGRRGRGQA